MKTIKQLYLTFACLLLGLSFGHAQMTGTKSQVQPKYQLLSSATLTPEQSQSIRQNAVLKDIFVMNGNSNSFVACAGYKIYDIEGMIFVLPEGDSPSAYMERKDIIQANGRVVTFVCMCPSGSGVDNCSFGGNSGNKCQGGDCCQRYREIVKKNGDIILTKD